jgi:molecular chaperone GrpE
MLNGDRHGRSMDKRQPPQKDGKEEVAGHAEEVKKNEAPTTTPAAGPSLPPMESKEGEVKVMTERLAQLEAECADIKDKYLRKYAEFENYKKRMLREREEAAKYSNAMLLLDIVGTIDNFERAIKSAADGKDFKNFHSGITLIERQLVSTLEKKWGLERFSAKGAQFDPERHEAVMAEQSASVQTPTVVEDLQSGYLLHGRVLRPAKVKVLQPASDAKSQPAAGENDKKAD